MNWPNHADYAEAIQNPEICFELPELHTGVVATTPLGLPRALSGNFASVYEVEGAGGTYAVRCFVRQVTNQQDRYAALERHLEGLELPCMVPFQFVSRGIRVHERWFPIVRMDWVKGVPLHAYVEQQLQSPERLAWLAADWRSMMAELKQHRIGHGDLQHGNVLVTPEGDLRLVDYDGMYVPLFARERSPELGHANYQHPRRTAEFYDERLDHFPELLIYLSLRALAAEPLLWHEYFNGDNLVVTAVDLRVPQCSGLWPRLLKSPDHDVRCLTVLLVEYLQRAPADVPSLEVVLNERMGRVVVPETLQLPELAGSFGIEESPETGNRVVTLAGRLESPLAAMNIERTGSGSRPSPPPPRLVDVFGWSAMITVFFALAPPLRTIAALASMGLSLLAWVMPGRRWQPARLAALLSAVLAVACIWIGDGLRVSARLPDTDPGIALSETRLDPPANMAAAQPIAAGTDFPAALEIATPGVVTNAVRTPVVDQAVSRPLQSPVPVPVAAVVERWKPHAESVSSIILSADGRHLISAATDHSVVAWDLVRRAPAFARTNLPEPIISLTALTNVGIVTLLDAMHRLQWWSLDGAVPLKTLALDPDSLVPPAVSPDGQVIALGGRERREVALDFNTGPATRQTLAGLSSWAKLVRFAPDSHVMAVVCLDDSISLYHVGSANVLQRLEFADAGISDVAFSGEGRLLAAIGEKGRLRVWSTDDGRLLTEQVLPVRRPVLGSSRSDDPSRFFVGSAARVTIVSLAKGATVLEEVPTQSPVTAVAGLADDRGFVTGHLTGEIAIWQFSPGGPGSVARLVQP